MHNIGLPIEVQQQVVAILIAAPPREEAGRHHRLPSKLGGLE